MAIEHVVLMKFSSDTPEARLQEIYDVFPKLIGAIPGVETASLGANIRLSSSEYTHIAVVRVADRQALEAFGPHENHVAMGAMLSGIMLKALILDYETEHP